MEISIVIWWSVYTNVVTAYIKDLSGVMAIIYWSSTYNAT